MSLNLPSQTFGACGGNKPVFIAKPKRNKVKQKAKQERAAAKKPKPAREGISPRLRAMVLERDRYACVLCGATAESGAVLHIGHITPVCQGGTNDESNLRCECRDCNLGGGARRRPTPTESIPPDRIVKQLAKLVGKKNKPQPEG